MNPVPENNSVATCPPVEPEPMTEPETELFATTVEFEIVSVSIVELPHPMPDHSTGRPVPIAEPDDELPASTCEFEIETIPMDEVPPEYLPSAVPIPEPRDELVATTVEFQMVRVSIRE
jgi:hypothetical protein